ncbi:MAG: ribose 5-phosphate isomerase B [Deltaproteobacteria bacterium]|nr:ribose 5-phosphate isomerase B [Deltaproteobacteria bacterium]
MGIWSVACDHAGFSLKPTVLQTLEALGHTVLDLGTHSLASVDYPDFAHALAASITTKRAEFGVLICGSGIGISIAANRHEGVRAALCGEPLSAALARQHNDANVVCMGARLTGPGMAEAIVRAFSATSFEGGRHQLRVAKIER